MPMKSQAMLMVALATGSIAVGGTEADPLPGPAAPSVVRSELSRLVKVDLAKQETVEKARAGEAPEAKAAEGTVVMSPYIVREQADFEPVVLAPEFPVFRVLQKGILYDPVGKAQAPLIKMHFYTVEADGIGNIRPRSGVEVAAVWAW
jgi:hypothetical protein